VVDVDVVPGGIYEHYKSTSEAPRYYRVHFIARHTETDDTLVIYKPLYSNPSYVGPTEQARPYSMFIEDVDWNGQTMPRFRYLGPSDSMWRLEGYDTFDQTTYRIDDIYFTEPDALRAAQERLASLETTQPSESSGGQDADGIQDHIYIIRPNGTKYRFSG
jgi:hypothetical protein